MQAPEQTAERVKRSETLRLALSMRGGVSLAVWIGGAVAEIDVLRLCTRTGAPAAAGNQQVYKRLLELANYDRVEIDILTGASAGGLNGAIYAASLVYGFEFAAMADIWLELADIEALSRSTTWRPGQKRPPSLFEGDEYFLAMCDCKLNELTRPRTQSSDTTLTAQVPRLDLFLSATRRVAKKKILRNDSFNGILESRSSAFFHFRHLGELDSPLSDFGTCADEDEPYGASLERLARSGRASSSFPVAFEPAKITSKADIPRSGSNLFGIFSEVGTDVEVIDGGVLDNIPVARAIQAIAAAPADSPAARWLLYLHPSPAAETPEPEGRAAAEKRARLRGILSDLKTTLTLKFNNESLVEDMVELDRHNDRVLDRRTTRVGLLQTGQRVSLDTDTAYAAWGAIDAQRVKTLLADPTLATATHPFVKREYHDLSARWTSMVRSALDATLADRIRDHYKVAGTRDPTLPLIALGDTVEVLLGIAQQVYVEGGRPERVLYRVRLLVEVLNSIWEQSWLDEAALPPVGDTTLVNQWIRDTAFSCMVRSEVLTDALITAVQTDIDESSTPFHNALFEFWDTRVGGDLPKDLGSATLEPMWRLVQEQAEILIREAGGISDPVIETLRGALADTDRGLRWFSLVCAPLQRRVLTGESPINFLRVSGANTSPLSPLFQSQTTDGLLSVTDKLAGNQVANFGAFFSAQWRANDWMWGRLDAAKSLVDLLADSNRWFRPLSIESPPPRKSVDDTLRELKRVVTEVEIVAQGPAGSTQPSTAGWAEWLAEKWEAAEEAIKVELSDGLQSAGQDVSIPMPETKKLLVTRLQVEILANQIRRVTNTPAVLEEPPVAAAAQEIADCAATMESACSLTAGIEKVPGSLDTKRWASIGMRIGLNAWRALLPTSWLKYAAMIFKPVYLFVLACVVFPRRAMFSGILGFGVLAVGRWERDSGLINGDFAMRAGPAGPIDYITWQRLAAVIMTALLAIVATASHFQAELPKRKNPTEKDERRRTAGVVAGAVMLLSLGAGLVCLWPEPSIGLALLVAAVVAGGLMFLTGLKDRPEDQAAQVQRTWAWRGWLLVVLAGVLGGGAVALVSLQVSLLPVTVPIAAILVVLVGMNWMPPLRLVGCLMVVLAPYLLVWLALRSWAPSLLWGWWALIAFAAAVYGSTIYVTLVDVFPNRKGPVCAKWRPAGVSRANVPVGEHVRTTV